MTIIPNEDVRGYRIIAIAAFIFFTAIIAVFYYKLWATQQRQAYDLAKIEAESNVNKDLAYRMWATHNGGIYVPVSEKIKPSPWLTHIPEQNITTPSGKVGS